jgi:hypothetical protein
MLHALTSPVFRSIAVAGVLVALTLSQASHGATKSRHGRRMVLHAPSAPNSLYLTAWRHGDVPVPFDGNELVPLKYTTRALIEGCRWLATETLVPVEAGRYSYRYDETLLGCEPKAVPWNKTPRTGYVTVVR